MKHPQAAKPADAAGLHPAMGSARAQSVPVMANPELPELPETTVSATSPGTLTQPTGFHHTE